MFAKKTVTFLLFALVLGSTMLITGCKKEEKTVAGAVVGGAAGAGVGAAAGSGGAAVAGGVIGALTGGLIGHSFGDDKKETKEK